MKNKSKETYDFVDRFIAGLSPEEKSYACDKLQSSMDEEKSESEGTMIDMEKLKSPDFSLSDDVAEGSENE
jgi:hypothetical protein